MNDDRGTSSFVRLARKFFRSDLWKEHREYSRAEAWLDMIATAAIASETRLHEGRCLNLRRGELLASHRYLGQRWSWSRSKVVRFLEFLCACGRIRARNEPGITVVTLCNYSLYNPARTHGEPATGPPTRPSASQQQAKVEEGKEPEIGENFAERGRGARANFAEAPSREEVQAHAAFIGLAPWKADDWFDEMEGGGWLDHQHRPIAAWTAVLNRVKTKWEADGRPSGPPAARTAKAGDGKPSATTSLILAQKELDRIEATRRDIRNSYSEHQNWSETDVDKFNELTRRRKELKAQLGFKT